MSRKPAKSQRASIARNRIQPRRPKLVLSEPNLMPSLMPRIPLRFRRSMKFARWSRPVSLCPNTFAPLSSRCCHRLAWNPDSVRRCAGKLLARQAIRQHGLYGRGEALAKLEERTTKTIDALGGWRSICDWSCDQSGILTAQFRGIYQDISRREDARTDPPVNWLSPRTSSGSPWRQNPFARWRKPATGTKCSRESNVASLRSGRSSSALV